MTTPSSQTLERALTLFSVILQDEGESGLRLLADRAGLPFSTAHRLAASLARHGMIQTERRGRYVAGPAMLTAARRLDEGRLIARLSRPALSALAHRLRQTVHLGVLEEGMVTYLVKESHGTAATFTREGMQLEAYCSGIGKVLLAHLDEDRRERYLADGPFVALTANTIVEPAHLRDHLRTVKDQGWGLDDAEVFETLKCMAAPLRRSDGVVIAAVSVSSPSGLPDAAYEKALAALQETIAQIEAGLKQPSRGEARQA